MSDTLSSVEEIQMRARGHEDIDNRDLERIWSTLDDDRHALAGAHARIAELTEAFTKFRSLTHQFTRGGIDRCADCGRLGVSKVDSKDHSPECEVAEAYAVYDAALTTPDTPRGLGPAGVEKVREALEATECHRRRESREKQIACLPCDEKWGRCLRCEALALLPVKP